ncbi:MAG: nicotinamide-nucleotide amidohydrolase family protein [Treponema sp.]|jgi:PncC family amidohydrolase|nr:nicotinamide-nucleotide amidohydrolase family protein [Treponema sp.]
MTDALAQGLIHKLSAASKTLVLAESCTAGLVADLLARIPGASGVLWGSFVCYTGAAKTAMLGVAPDLIRQYGAVSRETACAMVQGALARSSADMAVSVTGLAGPDGDGTSVPVGTVWIGTAVRGQEPAASVFHYTGSRNDLRAAAALTALGELINRITRS